MATARTTPPLTATISDNSAVMLVAKYSIQRLKLYGGYERITYMAPSDPQTAFTDIAGSFLCENCTAINNTNIVNTAFGRDGFGNKILQVMWTGVRYSVTEKLDVVANQRHCRATVSRLRAGVGLASSTLKTYESENAPISNLPSVCGPA